MVVLFFLTARTSHDGRSKQRHATAIDSCSCPLQEASTLGILLLVLISNHLPSYTIDPKMIKEFILLTTTLVYYVFLAMPIVWGVPFLPLFFFRKRRKRRSSWRRIFVLDARLGRCMCNNALIYSVNAFTDGPL